MKIEEIGRTMLSTGALVGWDAAVALNAGQLNAAFFQQWLQEGPSSRAVTLNLTVPGTGNQFWTLVLLCGPPEVSFPSSGLSLQEAQVTMYVAGGIVVQYDAVEQQIISAVPLLPNQSQISGTLQLSKTSGTDDVGSVVLNLAAGAWTPSIGGITAQSTVATELTTALQTYFANNATQYQITTLLQQGLPAALAPTNFDIVTQPNPAQAGDGAVVVLVQTSGPGGSVAPLQTYPIPDGSTAALILSANALYTGVIAPGLNASPLLQALKFTFTGNSAGNVTASGTLDLGQMGDPNNQDSIPFSSNADKLPADVTFDAGTFNIQPASDGVNLNITWNTQWTQYWTYITGTAPISVAHVGSNTMTLTYSATWAPAVDPQTDIVTFTTTTTTPSVVAGPLSWAQQYLEWIKNYGGDIATALQSDVGNALAAFPLPAVNTFAIANLIFEDAGSLSLTSAVAPHDLLLTGSLAPAVTVSPSNVTLAPGGTQAFTTNVASPIWQVSGAGSIDQNGLYTASAAASGVALAVVTVIDSTNEQSTGRALAIIAPQSLTSANVMINPAEMIVTPGNICTFVVTDGSGNPLAGATCTASDSSAGTLQQGFEAGEWSFTAAAGATDSTQVTITATNGTDSNTAVIYVVPPAAITLTPSSASVAPGGTVSFSASSDDFSDFTWSVYGGGSLAPGSDESTVTYTADANATSGGIVAVVVFAVNGEGAGVAVARVSITS